MLLVTDVVIRGIKHFEMWRYKKIMNSVSDCVELPGHWLFFPITANLKVFYSIDFMWKQKEAIIVKSKCIHGIVGLWAYYNSPCCRTKSLNTYPAWNTLICPHLLDLWFKFCFCKEGYLGQSALSSEHIHLPCRRHISFHLPRLLEFIQRIQSL